MINWTGKRWPIWLLVLAACSNNPSASGPILGDWTIVGMTPAILENDTVKSATNLIALFVAHDSLKPSTISINQKTMVVRSDAGDSSSLDYTVLQIMDNRFTLRTPQGDGTFLVGDSNEAKLNIAGATYELKR